LKSELVAEGFGLSNLVSVFLGSLIRSQAVGDSRAEL
jgi:hypothetical protein